MIILVIKFLRIHRFVSIKYGVCIILTSFYYCCNNTIYKSYFIFNLKFPTFHIFYSVINGL